MFFVTMSQAIITKLISKLDDLIRKPHAIRSKKYYILQKKMGLAVFLLIQDYCAHLKYIPTTYYPKLFSDKPLQNISLIVLHTA